MTDNEVELEVQAKGLTTAPRLTPKDIDAAIDGEGYTVLPDQRTTVCMLVLQNGFTVTGISSVISKENFDQELGRKIARAKAIDKVWELEAYLLQDKIHKGKQ